MPRSSIPSSQPPDNEGNASPSLHEVSTSMQLSTATQADDLSNPNDEPMGADPESRIAHC